MKAREVWLEVQGVRTFARVMGAGPKVVLVPGMGCSHLYYGRLQEALAPYFEVWAYDPPGQGYSRAPSSQYRTMRKVSDHLAAWLEAARLHGAVLFGHSQGGEVVLDLAGRYPGLPSRLVLCAPTGIPEYPRIPWQLLNFVRNAPRERLELGWRVVRSYFMAGPSRVWALLYDQLNHHILPLMRRVHVPVLVLVGTRDPIIRPRLGKAFEEALPHALLRVIEGGTHALHDSRAEEVARAVLEFCPAERQAVP
ncbi:MAG: alpha/beta hydrolase [Meiothermus sp.]